METRVSTNQASVHKLYVNCEVLTSPPFASATGSPDGATARCGSLTSSALSASVTGPTMDGTPDCVGCVDAGSYTSSVNPIVYN